MSSSSSTSSPLLGELLQAVHFAAQKHSTQRRKDAAKTPYINHPVAVAESIANEGGVFDLAVLQAAVLHDTVEDTDCTLDEIEQHFGREVRDLVDEVTDDKSLPKEERKRLQVVNAPHKSHKAKLVKLADKLNNLRDLSVQTPVSWTKERADQYFVWAEQVVDGMRGTNAALERLLDDVFKAKKQQQQQ